MDILNAPTLWLSALPRPAVHGHKYDRGHVVVVGGLKMTGAARLSAQAAARIGGGLVTIIAPASVSDVYRVEAAPHIMIEDLREPSSHLADTRRNVVVVGPGLGADRAVTMDWLRARNGQHFVVDADGLNALDDLTVLKAGDVLTPHAGEFQKLFGDVSAQEAAKRAGCVLVLKGAQTVITDGMRSVVNDHASPYLASAGTGDVLAGLIAGLVAQGMGAFDAACAGVWMHGEAGRLIGPGLVAPDIAEKIPGILKALIAEKA